MSVTVVVGKPGSGKTLCMLQLYIIPALLAGRVVYHNIPGLNAVKVSHYLRYGYRRNDTTSFYVENLLNDYSNEFLGDNWRDLFPNEKSRPADNELGEYYLHSIPSAPPGSLVVLDEAQKKCYINSKDWNTDKNKRFMEYCSVHRKSKHEVLIVTQNDENIDSSVNGIREELIFLQRQERLGFFFRNRVQLKYYLGHQTIKNVPYATSGVNYNKAIFGLYDSYDAKLSGDTKKEIRKPRNVFASPKFLVLCVAGVALVTCNGKSTLRLFQGKGFVRESASVSSSSSFSLGDYYEYYCGEKFYVLRPGGKVDTLEPNAIPPGYCPRFSYTGVRK